MIDLNGLHKIRGGISAFTLKISLLFTVASLCSIVTVAVLLVHGM